MSPSCFISLKREEEVEEDKSIKKEKRTGQSQAERTMETAKSQLLLCHQIEIHLQTRVYLSIPHKSLHPIKEALLCGGGGGYLLH